MAKIKYQHEMAFEEKRLAHQQLSQANELEGMKLKIQLEKEKNKKRKLEEQDNCNLCSPLFMQIILNCK